MTIRRPYGVPHLLIGLLIAAVPISGMCGETSTESWFAVIGEASGAAGRGFHTTLLITNTSGAKNRLELSFFGMARPGAPPRVIALQLAPFQPGRLDVGTDLTGTETGGLGALRIHGSEPFVAQAILCSRGKGDPAGSEVGATIDAIASTSAIGLGETTTLPAPAATARYKIYAVETHGFPVNFSLTPLDASGRRLPARNLYLGAHEQRSWTLAQLLTQRDGVAALELKATNGSGRLIALGTDTNQLSQDFNTYEMSLPQKARNRMSIAEISMYIAVALALIVAAVVRRTKSVQGGVNSPTST